MKRSIYPVLTFSLAVFAMPVVSQANGLTEVTLKKSAATSKPQRHTDKIETSTIKVNRSSADTDRSPKVELEEAGPAPLLITVSLKSQQLSLYRGLKLFMRSNISSGKQGHSTPTGIFSILGKKKYHESNAYSNAPMPYMQRLTWSGIALHESKSVPRFPASHGCVRLPGGFAKSLYGRTPRGTHVIISPEEVVPRSISHPSLFQPIATPAQLASLRLGISDIEASLSASVMARSERSADKSAPLRIYVTRTTRKDRVIDLQEMLISLGYLHGEADGLYGGQTISAVKRFQSAALLSKTGTMSKETVDRLRQLTNRKNTYDGKVYVRQGQKPIFESPIGIKQPTRPLGTHLFLTTAFTQASTGWISVNMSSRIRSHILRDHEIAEEFQNTRVKVSTKEVLDRIEIPKEAREFIEKNINQGTSFAISDNGLGTETGKGTDFIVQTY